MVMELKVGMKQKEYETVMPDRTAQVWGSGTLPVYATPAMVRLMEKACAQCVQPCMAEGQTTVGTKLDVSHLSASPLGMTIYVESELIEIDRKRLVFSVKAYDEVGKIGEGTHERFIIDEQRFMEKAKSKCSD